MRHAARLATLVFAERDDRVLLRRNPPTANRFPGLWNGLGGHVEAGEDIAVSARREVREEAGLEVDELRLRLVLHEAALENHAYVVFVFAATVVPGELRAEEGCEVAWIPVGDLAGVPVVPDLPPLLVAARGTGEVVFGFQQYDGTDRTLGLTLSGRPVALDER